MSTPQYYYLGDFEQSTTNGEYFGYPYELVAYNPFNGDTTQPLVDEPDTLNQAILYNYNGNQIDRSGSSISTFQSNGNGQSMALYVAGGSSSYHNVFGVGVSTSSGAVPTLRYILVPNTRCVPGGSASSDAEHVQGSMALPIPATTALPTIQGYDVMGTPIASISSVTFFSTSTAVYITPFILPNAWRFTDGNQPYVDTTVQPYWSNGSLNFQDGLKNHLARQLANTSVPATVFGSHDQFSNLTFTPYAYGLEDWTVNVNDVNDFYINKDYNDVVFGIIVLTDHV